MSWDRKKNSNCFTNPWDTRSKREKLWCTCNRQGREIGTLLLYGIGEKAMHAMANNNSCDSKEIDQIRTTLAEGHAAVNGLEVR